MLKYFGVLWDRLPLNVESHTTIIIMKFGLYYLIILYGIRNLKNWFLILLPIHKHGENKIKKNIYIIYK